MKFKIKEKQMGSLGTSDVWLNQLDYYYVGTMIECREHQQGLDPKLAPYTDYQSTH